MSHFTVKIFPHEDGRFEVDVPVGYSVQCEQNEGGSYRFHVQPSTGTQDPNEQEQEQDETSSNSDEEEDEQTFQCGVCLQDFPESNNSALPCCTQRLCNTCEGRVRNCPFCRQRLRFRHVHRHPRHNGRHHRGRHHS